MAENKEDRKAYKLAMLIAINADNEEKAIMAIRDKFRKGRIFEGLTNKDIISRLNRFKEIHPRVAKYINTGIGRRLQNLDSRIIDIILKALTKKGIPCLPVHDSYIIPERNQDLLSEVMFEAYRKIMKGYEPVIDKK